MPVSHVDTLPTELLPHTLVFLSQLAAVSSDATEDWSNIMFLGLLARGIIITNRMALTIGHWASIILKLDGQNMLF